MKITNLQAFWSNAWSVAMAALLLSCCVLPSAIAEIEHAQHFSIEEKQGFKILTIKHPFKGGEKESFRYVLYPSGTKKPNLNLDAVYVQVPIKRVIVLPTTYLGVFDVLGVTETLVGVGNFAYVNTPSVIELIHHQQVIEVGSEMAKNVELMLTAEPEVVFANAIGNPDYDIHPELEKMGVIPAITASYMEKTLLGRCEWIKFIAAFFNKSEIAEDYFNSVVKEYDALKTRVASVKNRPTVLLNSPWGGVWYIPPANSYIASALEDAGADYLWEDLVSDGSVPMDFEVVYERALEADVWINTGYLDTPQSFASHDARYLDFSAVKNGEVFSETARVNATGGNDFWERGFIHPEEVFADLVSILHPDLLPDHQLVYYKKVEAPK